MNRLLFVIYTGTDVVVFFLQDAGWLTGIKESDWLTRGAGAQKGLFPENFTQRLE